VRKVADAVQALATEDATGGVGFFVAANQEGGLIQALAGAGFVMSDSLTADAVSNIAPGQRAIDFIEAGGDMIVLGPIEVAVPMVEAVAERARADAAFRSRIDESALRILEAKDAAGLLPCSG
jgi:beta-N-acetylhexosaminidase